MLLCSFINKTHRVYYVLLYNMKIVLAAQSKWKNVQSIKNLMMDEEK